MDIGISAESAMWLAAALLASGLVMGFVSGLLGIGGGGILIPVLYETFAALGVAPEIRMHMALGTSLAVIVPTSLRALSAHWKRGSVDVEGLKRFGLYAVAGVILGVLVADRSSSMVLKGVWVVFASLLAAKMAFGRDDWRLGPDLPKSKWVETYFVGVGFVSVLLSIGGGSFLVLIYSLYNRPMIQAVSTGSGLGPLIAIPGALGFIWAGWGDPLVPAFSLGYVSLLGAALIIPASVFAAPLGVRLSHGISKRKLEMAFAAFLTLVALRFSYSLMAG